MGQMYALSKVFTMTPITRLLQLKDEKGYTFIHPFDDEDVIAGQGTHRFGVIGTTPGSRGRNHSDRRGWADLRSRLCHQELEPEYQSLRSASQRSAQHVKLYRAWENRTPRRCPYHSRRYRRKKEPGIHTFDLCQQYVDEIVSVTDDEISTAILALIEQHKLIAEGAGAVAVAAAMFNKVPIKGKKK